MIHGKLFLWLRAGAFPALIAVAPMLLAVGCSEGAPAGREQVESVAEHADGLSSTEADCYNWSLAERSLTGGGEFISPATYGTAGCYQGYRLNLTDYDNKKYNQGAVVGWGGAVPTTQATCTGGFVRAYVWIRNSDASMTYVGSQHTYGKWIIGDDGVGRCRPPTIDIERDIGITPNGTNDYRIAMTARMADNTLVPVMFATVEDHYVSPIDEIKKFKSYSATLAQYSGTNLEPGELAFWTYRNTVAGQAVCRRLDVDRGLHAFTRAAFIKAGATAVTVDTRISALNNIRAALCTSSGTAANLHSAISSYVTQTIAIRDQIENQLLTLMPAIYTVTRQSLAANTMAQINVQAVGSLVSKCDLDATPLNRYLSHGILPAGVTDSTRVVLGACSGQSPALAASSIGFGAATPNVSNPISAMADCMAGLSDSTTIDRCSSPLTQGAPDAPAADDPNENIPCINSRTGQACDPALDAKQKAFEAQVTAEQQKRDAVVAEIAAATTTYAPQAPKFSIVQALTVISIGADMMSQILTVSAPVTGPATAGGSVVAAAAFRGVAWTTLLVATVYGPELEDWYNGEEDEPLPNEPADVRSWCESNPGAAKFCDTVNPDTRYCPADPMLQAQGLTRLGSSAWLETGGPGHKHQATKQDLFNHCLCNLVDTDYAKVGQGDPPSRAPATSCPQSEEQRKLACVADPRLRVGDDDRPDFKCVRLLSPGPEDPNTWRARDCTKKTCPVNQKPFAKDDGQCVCETVNPVSTKFPNCSATPRASSGLCTQDNAAPCFCEPLTPSTPNGGDPFCRQNVNVLPAPLWSWMTPDSDTLYLDAFNSTTDVLRARTAGNTQFVSPTYYPNTFATRGTVLRQKVILNKAPAAGQNVDLKLYYTNRTKNVVRSSLGQCRMNTFTVGALSNCDFTLPTINGVNAGTLEDPFELEMEVITPTAYTTRVGLGPVSFTGSLTTTPAAKLAPLCPTPDPLGGFDTVTIRNPLPAILNIDTLPNPKYTLPSGTLLSIPYGRPVVRVLQ